MIKEKFDAHQLNDGEIEVNQHIKELCTELDDYVMKNINDCNEKQIALMELEAFAMWSTKAVALHGNK